MENGFNDLSIKKFKINGENSIYYVLIYNNNPMALSTLAHDILNYLDLNILNILDKNYHGVIKISHQKNLICFKKEEDAQGAVDYINSLRVAKTLNMS